MARTKATGGRTEIALPRPIIIKVGKQTLKVKG